MQIYNYVYQRCVTIMYINVQAMKMQGNVFITLREEVFAEETFSVFRKFAKVYFSISTINREPQFFPPQNVQVSPNRKIYSRNMFQLEMVSENFAPRRQNL